MLAACGGGGTGSGGFDPTSPFPTTPPGAADSTPLDGRLLWDGPLVAEVGIPYEASLFVGGAQPLVIPPTLAAAPEGLSLDPEALALSWTPRPGQEGIHVVEITQGIEGYELGRERFEVVVASRSLEAQAYATARTEARLVATRSGSPIEESVVYFPPGALRESGTLELHDLTGHPLLPRHTTYVELLPSQDFLEPVTIRLPYSEAFLQASSIADEGRLAIYALDDEGREWQQLESTVDSQRNLVTARTMHFSRFAVWMADTQALTPSARERTREQLAPFQKPGSFDPDYDLRKFLLDVKRRATQPRRIFHVGGRGGQRNGSSSYALVVHGLLSNQAAMANLTAYVGRNYDHVYAYEYPSGGDIRQNGAWLAQNLGKELPEHARIDVYAHSMGGLVTRYMLEESAGLLWMMNLDVANAVFLGTPHSGADPAPLSMFFDGSFDDVFDSIVGKGKLFPGLEQLHSEHAHFSALNRDPQQGWTRYWLIAGHQQYSSSDGWVGMESAAAKIFDPQNTTYWTYTGLEHSELHDSIASNGIGRDLDLYMDRKAHGDANAPSGMRIYDARVAVGLREVEEIGRTTYEYASVDIEVDLDVGRFRMVPGTIVQVTLEPVCRGPSFSFTTYYAPEDVTVGLPPDSMGTPDDRHRFDYSGDLPADGRIELRGGASFGPGKYELCSGDTPESLTRWNVEVQVTSSLALAGALFAPGLGVSTPTSELIMIEAVVTPSYR